MSQIYDFSHLDALRFLKDNFDKVFFGGNVEDPDSQFGVIFRKYASQYLNGVGYDDSQDQVPFSQAPDELKTFIKGSYAKVFCSNENERIALSGDCTTPPQNFSCIIPLALAGGNVQASLDWGGSGGAVYFELYIVLPAYKENGTGVQPGKTIQVLYTYEVLDPTPDRYPEEIRISTNYGWGLDLNPTNGRSLIRADENGILNMTDNTTSFESGDADILRCTWLALPINLDFYWPLSSPVGVSFKAKTEDDCWPTTTGEGEIKYAVVNKVGFNTSVITGDNQTAYVLVSDIPISSRISAPCNEAPSSVFEDFGGDCDILYSSLEEAHEAYPDLFPLDSPGLSATRKHFIRIS